MFNGPLPTPTAIKIAEGNPGKQKLPANEPKPAALVSVEAPEFLSADAKVIWDGLAPELFDLGLLTKADLFTFAKYCDSEALYWKFRQELGEDEWIFMGANKKGLAYQQANQKAMMMHQAFQRAEKLAHHFGLSPATRARLGHILQDQPDELDELIAGKPE